MQLQRLINYAGWPVASGLLIALLVILFKPEWLRENTQPRNLPAAATQALSTEAVTQNIEATDNNEVLLPQTVGFSGPISYADAVKRAAPAVVNIYSTKPRPRHPLLDDPIFRQYFNIAEPPEQRRILSSMGSGVIVSPEGYIVTNQHVINGADEFFVFLNDGRQVQAMPIGANIDADIAVLKIDLDDLTPIQFGLSENTQVGDVVLAIGNPFGFGQSVSQGIISATSRLGKTSQGVQSYLQTDAAINPGNSGGALVDVFGNLLGINTAILGNSSSGESIGIGFAIPADVVAQVLKDIIEFSQTVHGYLGVMASPLTPRLARSLQLSFTNGLVITKVDPQSPAHGAGLQPGDVITRVNDQTFEVDGRLIASEIARGKPGESVELEIWRNGEAGVVTITLGEAKQQTPTAAS